MARKLPWVESNHSSKSKPKPPTTSTPRALKRVRTRFASPTTSDSGIHTPTVPESEHIEFPKRTHFRSSSNSPLPSPPPYELMHHGLSGDDIYVMVEDEFHAIAQSFTQHLHHAEYRRLKTLARERHGNGIGRIARPTVGKVISREKELNKEQQRREKRYNKGLEKIGALGDGNLDGRRDEEPNSESDVEAGVPRDDETEMGKSVLGVLMSSNRPKNTSLMGLQGIASSTRAAKGFKRPEKPIDSSRPFGFGKSVAKSQAEGRSTTNNVIDDECTTATDSDDLEKSVPSRNSKVTLHKTTFKEIHSKDSNGRKASVAIETDPKMGARSSFDQSTKIVQSWSVAGKKDKSKHDSPGLNDPIDFHMRSTPLLSNSRLRGHSKSKTGETKIENIDEIPVFLV